MGGEEVSCGWVRSLVRGIEERVMDMTIFPVVRVVVSCIQSVVSLSCRLSEWEREMLGMVAEYAEFACGAF